MTVARSVLVLGAGSVLLLGVIALELRPEPASIVVAGAPASPAGAAVDGTGGHSARLDQWLATALARPLFSQTRRPPVERPESGADNSLGGARLTGIVIAPGQRLAIFAVAGGKPLELTEGETLSGWRVGSIAAGQVSLTGPGGSRTLLPALDPALVPPPPARSAGADLSRPAPAPPLAPTGAAAPRPLLRPPPMPATSGTRSQ